jgi:hypothetical protein
MSKIEKLIDLVPSNGMGDARMIARKIFNDDTTVDIEGYRVYLPAFETLSANCRDFIVKALLQCRVVNTLDLGDTLKAAEEAGEFDEEPASCPGFIHDDSE